MATQSGPGSSSRRGRSKQGRVTEKEARQSGRYTAPTPQSAKQSPRWWAPVFLGLLVLGVLVILLNYLSVFGHPSGWGLLVGLVIIAAGFVMATRYR
jgi:Cell division protein CrgA